MACPLDDRIVFPSRKYSVNDIPRSPSHWNKKCDIIYDFFNVANINVVQHEYIFDPYALFAEHQTRPPVTVSALVATHPKLPPAFSAKLAAKSSRKRNYEELVSEYNQEIHSSLTESYHAMMDALTYLGKNLPDFESDSSKPDDGNPLPEAAKRATGRSHQQVREWIDKCITNGFKFKCSKKENVGDSENWSHLYEFVKSVENIKYTESFEAVYEDIFLEFCNYVLTRSDILLLNKSKPQLTLMKKSKGEYIRLRPDLMVYNKISHNHLLMIEVSKPRRDIAKTIKAEILTSSTDEDTLKGAQSPVPDPSPIAKQPRCDIDSTSDEDTSEKAQAHSCDPSPINPGPSGGEKTPDLSGSELSIDDSVKNLFQDSDLLEADDNFLEDIETDTSKRYRHLEDRERRAIGCFLPQLLGKVFFLSKSARNFLFKHTDQSHKNLQYGIGVTGFKVMFVAVCIVDQEKTLRTPPTVTDFLTPHHSLRTDVFLTRQFSLLKSKDRKCIADMLFAICRSEEFQF